MTEATKNMASLSMEVNSLKTVQRHPGEDSISSTFLEAKPAGLYAAQFFEHLGFNVLGEFHGSEEDSTQGRMGDIRGLPNERDLTKVKQDTKQIVRAIENQLGASV